LIIDGLNVAAMSREQMQRTLDGGVDALNLTVFPLDGGFAEAFAHAEIVRAQIDAMPDLAKIVRSVADLHEAKENGQIGVIMGCQNADILDGDLAKLDDLHALGLRIMQATHNFPNRLGCGSACIGPEDAGVTAWGFEWLAMMEEKGIVVDLSHCGHRTSADFLARATQPPVFSHANAFDLFASPRNKPDWMLQQVAELGGVTGAVMYTPAVRGDAWPDLDDYADHIVHIARVAGIDHVGFATDISDGIVEDPDEWAKLWGSAPEDPITSFVGDWYGLETERLSDYHSLSDTPKLIDKLATRGFKSAEIDKIMGDNFLRVYADVWR